MDITPPSDAPLPFDATLLVKALQYQFLVAVEYCYDLEESESLWLEVFGDVTVPGKMQTEVKNYSDSLTDGHSNFWNTLKNWLHEEFDHTSFKNLVLLTTQEFGNRSQLKGWNKLTASERLAIMEQISTASSSRAKKKKNADQSEIKSETSKPSKSQSLQQYVMAPERRTALMEVLERMQIITGADSLEQRIQKYKTRHLKTIRASKYQQFIDDLLGFMCSTKLVSEGWQITHEAFSAKLTELTKQYTKSPTVFPQVDTAALEKHINIQEIRPMPFAQKIIEIGGEQRLKRAALHRLIAQTTISDFYKDGVLFKSSVDLYLRNHLMRHLDGRELAMLDCTGITCRTELKTRSMKFYLECHSRTVEPFCSLEHTMTEFRNGIYHMLAGDKPKDKDEEFFWRLW
ncbi:hypothetical protein [Acetobacter senegalensis]|uniref:hypothetical protein n=1 Tax=Acetobacter senegalensis TaxID=446692 RepID=UPI001B80D967|nr:hypothetical protein [Acetobacter senegalensis]